jgi:hypothetical protein
MADKKFRMQIVDETGQIVKTEILPDIDNGTERTITLLPSEKNTIKPGYEHKYLDFINKALEDRGLKGMEDEKATVEDGILTIKKVHDDKRN